MDGHGTPSSILLQFTATTHPKCLYENDSTKWGTIDSRAVLDPEKPLQHKFLSPQWLGSLMSLQGKKENQVKQALLKTRYEMPLGGIFVPGNDTKMYLLIWTIIHSPHFSPKPSKFNYHLWNVYKTKHLPTILLFPLLVFLHRLFVLHICPRLHSKY